MNISYDWYKIFSCVAECQNITAASEKLFISQPAVSQSIKQLEDSVGCQLFTRTPKGVFLTPEGVALYSYISKGINAFLEGERKLTAMLRLDVGEIRIGASDMTLAYCLLPYLEKFHATYPGIKISITNQTTPETISLLNEGKIDFGAISEPVVYNYNDFDIIPIREIQDIFICGKNQSAKYQDKISLLKLPPEQLIMLEKKTSTRSYLDSEFKKRNFSAEPKFELATSSLIVQFTARNLGIGCVVKDFANDAISNGFVKEIILKDPLPSRHICIIRKNTECSKAAITLMDMILGDKR